MVLPVCPSHHTQPQSLRTVHPVCELGMQETLLGLRHALQACGIIDALKQVGLRERAMPAPD